jgi:hypothetical protein
MECVSKSLSWKNIEMEKLKKKDELGRILMEMYYDEACWSMIDRSEGFEAKFLQLLLLNE